MFASGCKKVLVSYFPVAAQKNISNWWRNYRSLTGSQTRWSHRRHFIRLL